MRIDAIEMDGDLRGVPSRAADYERLGYDGLWSPETKHDPFFPLLLSAEHTTRIEVGTSVAVAFARNPMTVANAAWDLQAFSGGRFIRGLGTQVAPHITRRFSMPWSKPAARMREFVQAVRAIWSCWQTGERLQFEGEFYNHTIMTPYFDPGPQDFGYPKIYMGAVGPAMLGVAGEVADGLHLHSFVTADYIRRVVVPAVEQGRVLAGRTLPFDISLPVFLATGRSDEEVAMAVGETRKRIAFYASTAAYRPVLDLHGWGYLQEALAQRAKAGLWDSMAELIDDQMLEVFAIVAKPANVLGEVNRRYGGLVTRVGFHLAHADRHLQAEMLAARPAVAH